MGAVVKVYIQGHCKVSFKRPEPQDHCQRDQSREHGVKGGSEPGRFIGFCKGLLPHQFGKTTVGWCSLSEFLFG